jgi:anti-anti-sigma factor
MPFSVTSDVANGIARVTLTGELDASSAPEFKAEVETVAATKPRRLVLMRALEFMASAGLRVLIFAKQKMGGGTDIYVVGARPSIVDTLEMTGFQHSVVILPEYDAAQIERSDERVAGQRQPPGAGFDWSLCPRGGGPGRAG